jgi:type I restriction enzyme S subunit
MTNWKEYKLGEIAELRREKFTPNDTVSYPYLGLEHMEPKSLRLNGVGSSNDVSSQKSIFYPTDTLYGKLRPYFQKVYAPDFKGVCSTDIFVIKPKKGINPKFLFYLIASDEFTTIANSGSTGTRMPRADWKHLSSTIWNIPDLPTQTAIAEILSSLDDKIELNNKINQELESLAQTLFKRWFIDFEFPNENGEPYKSSGGEMVDSELGEIPKGWELKKLAELVKKSNTGADAIKRAPIVTEDTGIRCVRVGDMTNKRPFDEWGFCKITPEDYKRYKLEINDIIVTRTATLGINTIIRNEIKGVYNNGLIRLKMNEDKIIPLLAYCFFQSEDYKIWIERISGDSSTRPNMQINYLLDFPMYHSPMAVQKRFIEQASDIFKCLENNILENKELTSLRDTLLPKLISGELEVSQKLTQTTA